jgi:predicted ATPase/signal transduction histidine kinase/tRNA A-37 threonylcarbamoyl transferase component Bud32
MTISPAYTIIEPLSRGSKAILYRAIRGADHRPVVLKVLDPRRSRPKDLAQLKHEYEIEQLFDSTTVIKALALDTYQGMPALVLEDFGGWPLERLLATPMPLDHFLPLAIRIAGAIAEIHERGIVHKDLKPENILVCPDSGEVKIADFGIASRLPREQPAVGPPALIEGSLPYLSPEQTGRTNRAIDSRSDLYSLGVTFYQMLTGRLPFAANDPVEWVHCHVARAPQSPAELVPELPETITRIVLKLLSKMPEDRYQSARGLEHDWQRCLVEWRVHGLIEPFPLGERDIFDRLQIPQKLYGREAEVTLLRAAFDRVVAEGAPELLLISGNPGIGKSVLARELCQPVVKTGGFFASGKVDQYQRDLPYSTLTQALRELILEILAETEERIADWRRRLLDALGINGQLIVDVIPPLELVIGPQAPAPELPLAEAQNRFRLVFQHFIGVFAQAQHPLVLFLDDLQWADSASLALLKELVVRAQVRHLLIVGAYRDNEVSATHPLMSTRDEICKAAAPVPQVVLGPMSPRHLAALIGDALHSRGDDVAPLAELVYEKTAGNPFFAIQFLLSIHDEGLIAFDGHAAAFRWNVAKIRAKNYTDNVVDLMIGKLQRLPAATQAALEQLACLGNSAAVDLLTIVCGGSAEDTHAALWEAVRAVLVLRVDETYRFLHDRVQEAAYSRIPAELRPALHLRIGRLLLSRLPESVIVERVFEVANQLNHGAHLLTDPREQETLCRLDRLAGKKAKAAVAYASARSYLAHAAALLPPDAWSNGYEDTFALYLELAECEYLVGDFQAADALFHLLLQNARSHPDRARAYCMRMRLYQIAGRHADAITVLLEGLRIFGVEIPDSDEEIGRAAAAELRQVDLHLRGRRIAELVDAPVARDADVRALIGLVSEAMPLVLTAKPALWSMLATQGVNVCLQRGHAPESPYVYSCFAAVLASVCSDIPRAVQFSEMAIRLNETLDGAAATLRGKLLFHHGAVIHPWCQHFATSPPVLEQAFVALLDVGDVIYAGYLTFNMVWLLLENGDPLDHVIEVARKYAAFAVQTHNDVVYEVVRLEAQFAASLQGATQDSTSLSDADFDEARCVAALEQAGFGLGVTYYHIMKQIAAYTHERYAEALDCAARAAPMLMRVASMANEATYHFYYALTLTALYAQAPAELQRQYAQLLAQHLRKLELWAHHCPENFRNRQLLVSAEIARIEGRELDAERGYEAAIRSARDNSFVQQEALTYEVASRFYRGRGFDEIADSYLRAARACYARWGADGKVKQIDERHPLLFELRAPAGTGTIAVRSEQLDLLSVTKASQTISSEIVLDKLVRTLLGVVLEQGGARRACLLVCRDGSLSVEAEAAIEGGGVATRLRGSVPVDSAERLPASLVHYVQRTRERVILDDAGTGRFAGDDYFARDRRHAVLCLPILRQAEVVGLLYLENDLLAGAFTPDRLAALELLATQAAISLDNARLLAKEQAARAAAEDAERRSAFLAEAGVLLSESLDYAESLGRLGRLCVRSLADHCMIDIVEGSEIRRIAGTHADPAKEPMIAELQRRYPPRWDSPHPSSAVLRSGAALLLPEVTDEVLRPLCEDDQHFRLVRELGTCTALSVPLVARGQTLGVLTLGSAAPGRRFGHADVELAQEVARRAAIAIDNARLYGTSEKAVRLRDEFLSTASHELRTPITSLKLVIQSLVRGVREGGPAVSVHMLSLADQQTQRLAALIDQLLDIDCIEGGRLTLKHEEFDLVAGARQVLERMRIKIEQSGAPVRLRAPEPIVGCWDHPSIDRLLTNLLSNAITFGAGQPIDLTVACAAMNRHARIIVHDRGIGIAAHCLPHIFERFERAASSRHYGGLGLGLFIAREIVEAHGGTISVESEMGHGSSFTVELPLLPKRASS